MQAQVNRINAAVVPGHDRNSRFSVWNWLAIVAGVLFYALILIGLVAPAEST